MRRALIIWSVALALLVAAFTMTVVVLGSTMYSAAGFVGSYLDALARRDTATALQLPGVLAESDASSELLTDSALGELSDIRLVEDVQGGAGVHTVTYEYRMAGTAAESTYTVRQTGAFLGLFPTWTFDASPLARVAVTVLHDHRFRANTISLSSEAAPAPAPAFLVFAPGSYVFDHESSYLAADPIKAPITEPGSVTAVQVNVQANDMLVEQVKTELATYLDECATQEVLLPTGCPFGKSFENRVDSIPEWSIASYPKVEIIPGGESGSWVMPDSAAAAHLSVRVRSLFDGRVTTFDDDVAFSVSYGITLGENDAITIETLD